MERIEEQVHELDETKAALDKGIEDIKKEINSIESRLAALMDNFRTKRDQKISFSATRSQMILEQITNKMEDTEKEMEELFRLREFFLRELTKEVQKRNSVVKKREEMEEKYPSLCFRLCR